MEPISWKLKWNLLIFQENHDTEIYLKILTNMLPEMRSITDETLLLKWTIQYLIWRLTH